MRLHETRLVDRDIFEVFDYTANFDNIETWDPGVVGSTKVGSEPIGHGTKFEIDFKLGGSVVPLVYEITDFDRPNRVVLVGTGEPIKAVDVITFEQKEGATLIDYTADITFYNFFRFVAPVASPLMKRVGAKALDGLVAALMR